MEEKLKEIVEKTNLYKTALEGNKDRIKKAKSDKLARKNLELKERGIKKEEWNALEKIREENIRERELRRNQEQIKRWKELRGESS